MPTYEYRCEKCGEQFEVFQSFSDRALRRHPDCGGAVEKVLHPRGIVFKGSGFYVTDSRSKSSSSVRSRAVGSASVIVQPYCRCNGQLYGRTVLSLDESAQNASR